MPLQYLSAQKQDIASTMPKLASTSDPWRAVWGEFSDDRRSGLGAAPGRSPPIDLLPPPHVRAVASAPEGRPCVSVVAGARGAPAAGLACRERCSFPALPLRPRPEFTQGRWRRLCMPLWARCGAVVAPPGGSAGSSWGGRCRSHLGRVRRAHAAQPLPPLSSGPLGCVGNRGGACVRACTRACVALAASILIGVRASQGTTPLSGEVPRSSSSRPPTCSRCRASAPEGRRPRAAARVFLPRACADHPLGPGAAAGEPAQPQGARLGPVRGQRPGVRRRLWGSGVRCGTSGARSISPLVFLPYEFTFRYF